MFEFLSKLVSRRSSDQSKAQIAAQTISQVHINEIKKKTTEHERQQYLQKISASINNEANLLDLLTACDFADGRFQAAQHIHTQEYLEKALLITRKQDNRVFKLMQTRLDQIRQQQESQHLAQTCLQQAESLLGQQIVLANQLVELDKQASAVRTFPAELFSSFEEKRLALQERLNAQADLQRQLLQLVHDIERGQDLSEIDGDAALASWTLILQTSLSSPGAGALPKALLQDAQNKLAQFGASWEKWKHRSVQLQKIPASTKQEFVNVDTAASVEPNNPAQITLTSQTPVMPLAVPTPSLTLAQIEDLLSRFEAALAQGSAQSARQIEKELREIDTKRPDRRLPLSDSLKERLNIARKELANLMSWAKWSGAVSRDELIATAEKLTTLSLSPQEIVDTVSALREQWKQMESTGNAGPKELWIRFDAACKLVYAPAAAYFQSQSELRKDNLIKAEALLSQYAEDAEQILNNLHDWKLLRSRVLEMQQTWKKIGHVDRKERTRLDKEFENLLVSLKAPLEQRQQEEIQSREKMISEVEALDIFQKSSQDQLRSLQQRWQVQAIAVPLQRRDEQKLWERFRAACDGVFEKKRQLAESADQQRETNLKAKQAICQELTSIDCSTQSGLRRAIDNANLAWREVGHVPRAQEHAIENEFQRHLQRLQTEIGQLQLQESQLEKQKIGVAIATCQKLDTVLEGDALSTEAQSGLIADWQGLSLPNSKLAKTLTSRYERAINLTSTELPLYQKELQGNMQQYDALCLHIEILLGIESTTVASQERLKKQVEVLQSALKSTDGKSQLQELLLQLLGLPVIQSETRRERLHKVMTNLDLAQINA
ncbi:DUF349 domain-containing protein [Undibacterium sp. Ji22W]|uniref:DUF349 domain-containing protein n=1 Tax=Undibacterium sp. Ji22W TaxID=3413038 RepID=UPI003BF11078